MSETRIARGVTFTELLLVAIVLIALGALAVPRISRSAQNARQNACDTNLCLINSAIDMYAADHDGQTPRTTDTLNRWILDNPTYFPEGRPRCPLGGAYLLDAQTGVVTCTH